MRGVPNNFATGSYVSNLYDIRNFPVSTTAAVLAFNQAVAAARRRAGRDAGVRRAGEGRRHLFGVPRLAAGPPADQPQRRRPIRGAPQQRRLSRHGAGVRRGEVSRRRSGSGAASAERLGESASRARRSAPEGRNIPYMSRPREICRMRRPIGAILFPRVVSRGRSAASSEPYSSSRLVRPRQAVGGRSDDRLRAITPLAMSWSSRSGAAPPQRRVGQGRQTDPMRRQPGRSKAVRSLSELFPHARRSRRRRCDKPTPASPATRVSNRTSIPSTRNENQPRPISRARLMKAGGSCASVMTTAAIPASPPIVRRCSACSIASANDVSMWSSSTRSTAFGVDRPPKVDHSAVDFQIDLVEMPSRVRLHATLS